jgi:hypothetical protein
MNPINSLFPPDLHIPTFKPSDGVVQEISDSRQDRADTDDGSGIAVQKLGSRVSRSSASQRLSAAEFLQRKTQQALARKAARQSAGPLQMVFPAWDEDLRGLPNPLVRCGLFTAASVSVPRANILDEKVASLSNYSVSYSGAELRQDDLSVWLAIVSMGRNQPLGDPIHFTAYRLINDLRWRMHSDTYKSIKEIIERLKFTSVKLSSVDQKAQYAGSLIRDYLFDDTDADGKTCWTVRLEESIARLFVEDTTTLFEWKIRSELGRRATLANWLFSFYATHAEPIPYHISKIHELSKSDDRRIANFKVNIRAALEKLVTVGFLDSYAIQNDVVHVTRSRRIQNLKLAAC